MSLASALIKKVIEEQNLDTWSNLKRNYLPSEFHNIYRVIQGHIDKYLQLPTFEDMKYEVRDQATLDKIGIIEQEEVDTESYLLLDYLKSEFTQKELISGLDSFIDETLTYSNAEEVIQGIYEVIAKVENKVDLVKPRDSIEKIDLFDSEEEVEGRVKLGLNTEYDENFVFPNDSLIMIGGYRGSGKSIVCNNIAQYQFSQGKGVIKFSLEMNLRQELQRLCAIATGVPHVRIKHKELSVLEWEKVASWWASRYQDGEDLYNEVYLKGRDFTELHRLLIQKELAQPSIDIVHTPQLTMSKFKAEVLKRLAKNPDIGAIILDYMNKMSVSEFSSNKFDWSEQILLADHMKSFAEDIQKPIITPFQTKADGEVKWSKDILVPADAAYTLVAGEDFIEFENIKMRHMEEKGFISKMNWMTLQCGPETGHKIEEEAPQEL